MDITATLTALAQWGPLSALFGLVVWCGFQLGIRVLDVAERVAMAGQTTRQAEAQADLAIAEQRAAESLQVQQRLEAVEMAMRRLVGDIQAERPGGR